jgi:hypothetical protein
MTKDEALNMALEALDMERLHYLAHESGNDAPEYILEAIAFCEQALAEPAQEPVMYGLQAADGGYGNFAYSQKNHAETAALENPAKIGYKVIPFYTTPPAAQPAPVQTLSVAMKTVIEALQKDPDYAWSWHCNIAMAFVDAGGDHYTGNQGAARFMKTLANVEPAHELPTPPAAPAAQPVGQAPCVRHCEAMAFQIVIKNLRNEIERMKAAQRTWVGLTKEDKDLIEDLCEMMIGDAAFSTIDAILKGKNT